MVRRVSLLCAAALILTLAAVAQTMPRPDHIVIVMDENKGYADIIGSANANAPYINGTLVKKGALLTKFYALHHPSQPNYFEFFSGSNQGVCDDTCPQTFKTQNLATALLDAKTPGLLGGKGEAGGSGPLTFAGYVDQLPTPPTKCTVGYTYARRHCPWINFTNVPAKLTRNFKNFPQEAKGFAALPTVTFVTPDLIHDMHYSDTSGANNIPLEVQHGDAWLKAKLNNYIKWAMTHNSLFILTWDEDSGSCPTPQPPPAPNCAPCTGRTGNGENTPPPLNHIATIIIGQHVKPGSTSATQYNHYNLLRTILDMYGLAPFGGASNATDITGIWQ